MYVKGFKIGYDKNKRLWLIILGAITIAVLLIVIAFVSVYSNLNVKNISGFDIKDIYSYKASYKINVKSNKNQNNYNIEEEYTKGEIETFVFKIFDENDVITYTIDGNGLKIKSNNQKLEYILSDYIIKKENIISLSTFLDLYRKLDLNENDYFSINIEESDNKISYKINILFKDKKVDDEYAFLEKISKMELVINKENNTPCEYIVYDNENNAYIDIIYDKFFCLN